MNKTILVILSASNRLKLADEKVYLTGFYLNELMVPVKKMVDAGYLLVFATPGGGRPYMDAGSDSAIYFGGDDAVYHAHRQMLMGLNLLSDTPSLVSFASVLEEGIGRYAGIFVPGGHAPMEDLADDEELGDILTAFHEEGKPTALVCHGPVALLSAVVHAKLFMTGVKSGQPDAEDGRVQWPYAGYEMTVFSSDEEAAVQGENGIGGTVLFDPQCTLTRAGGRVRIAAKPFAKNVVVDRELVTGQNPASDEELAMRFLALIEGRGGHGD